jgi:hypothetical protein
MRLELQPAVGDVQYQFAFKTPSVSFLLGDSRFEIIENCINLFSLRAADLTFNNTFGQNNIVFKKFFDQCILEVSLGADEVNVTVGRAENVEQVHDLLKKVVSLFGSQDFGSQKITIRRQLSTDGDVDKYLSEIAPNVPDSLSNNISSRGIIHTIEFKDLNLTVKYMIEKSASLERGVFQFVDFFFLPNLYNFEETFDVVSNKYDFINKEYGLLLKEV